MKLIPDNSRNEIVHSPNNNTNFLIARYMFSMGNDLAPSIERVSCESNQNSKTSWIATKANNNKLTSSRRLWIIIKMLRRRRVVYIFRKYGGKSLSWVSLEYCHNTEVDDRNCVCQSIDISTLYVIDLWKNSLRFFYCIVCSVCDAIFCFIQSQNSLLNVLTPI